MRNPIHSWLIMSSWRNLGTDLFLGTLSLHMSKQFDPARPHLLRRPNLEMKRFKACMKMTRAKQVMSTSRRVKNDSFDYYVPAHVDFYGIEDFSLPSCRIVFSPHTPYHHATAPPLGILNALVNFSKFVGEICWLRRNVLIPT